ncbi:MAG: hypothetical protein OET44_09510 [Gammaproteobacteria bacterium]|nr:hypothetical protein [Gammaproteobacteria bacterium]
MKPEHNTLKGAEAMLLPRGYGVKHLFVLCGDTPCLVDIIAQPLQDARGRSVSGLLEDLHPLPRPFPGGEGEKKRKFFFPRAEGLG